MLNKKYSQLAANLNKEVTYESYYEVTADCELRKHFPNFHPIKAKKTDVPVFVSISQVQDVQAWLKQVELKEIVQIAELIAEHVGMQQKGIFPSEAGDKSHRSQIQQIEKLSQYNTANVMAVFFMLKLNHLKALVSYTDDGQLFHAAETKKDALRIFEAADIALAISDVFGELGKLSVTRSLEKRQKEERSANAVRGRADSPKGRLLLEAVKTFTEEICAESISDYSLRKASQEVVHLLKKKFPDDLNHMKTDAFPETIRKRIKDYCKPVFEEQFCKAFMNSDKSREEFIENFYDSFINRQKIDGIELKYISLPRAKKDTFKYLRSLISDTR